jgi:HSP20 family protein
MTIIRYNPWQEMNAIQRQLDRIFNDTMIPTPLTELANFTKVPAAELTETETALVLKLEVPGINSEDLDIQVTNKSVRVSGERKPETLDKIKGKTYSEFHYGKFERVIPLPIKIQNTKVTAEYKDGIVYLTLPKAETEQNKVVKVNLTTNES